MKHDRNSRISVCACGYTLLFLLLFLPVASSTVRAQPVLSPVHNAQVTQAFAAYDAGKASKYHTGIDISPRSPDYTLRRKHVVKALRDGKVVDVFGLRFPDGKWYVRWWDDKQGIYRWVTGARYVRANSNRGLGICVIVEHEGSPKVYTLYGHLDAVRANLKIGDAVHKDDFMGLVGNSGQGAEGRDYLRFCPATEHNHTSKCLQDVDTPELVTAQKAGFPPHLHFEVKYQPVLGDYSSQPGVGEVGYTSYDPFHKHPERKAYYFVDPLLWLYEARTLPSSRLEIVAESVKTHIGPGDYPQSSKLERGQEFRALAVAASTWPVDGSHWYLIEGNSGSLFPHPGGGMLPRIWVCEGTPGENWVTLHSRPNIQLVISVDRVAATPGTVVTVSVQATNRGDTNAIDATLICPIPQGTTYVEGSLTVDGQSYPEPRVVGNEIRVAIPSLAPGAQALVQFRVVVR